MPNLLNVSTRVKILGGFIAILDRRYRTSRKKNNRATQGATVGA